MSALDDALVTNDNGQPAPPLSTSDAITVGPTDNPDAAVIGDAEDAAAARAVAPGVIYQAAPATGKPKAPEPCAGCKARLNLLLAAVVLLALSVGALWLYTFMFGQGHSHGSENGPKE